MTYNSVVLADSPRHYLTFDQSAGAYTDTGSSAASLTITGSPTQNSTGVSGGHSVQLNGTSQTVSINSSYDFSAGSAWSFETWFKTSTNTGTPEIIRKDGSGRAYLLRLNAGNVEWYCNAAGIVTSGTNYADGKWHHVVGTYSSGTTKVYIDGALYGTTGTGNAGTQGSVATYIGSSGGTGEWFNGTLDEVAIYSVALTSTQVSTHYSAGANATVTPPAATMSLTAPAAAFAISVSPPAIGLSLDIATPDIRQHDYYIATASEDGFGSSTASDTLSINSSSSATSQINIEFADITAPASGLRAHAILSVYYQNNFSSGTTTATYNVYRVTSSWAPSSGSFTQPTYDSTSIGSFTVASGAASGWYTVDISAAAWAWAAASPNYGVAIVLASGTAFQHFAGYGATSNKPQLDVSYVPLPPNVTVTPPAATMSLATVTPNVGIAIVTTPPAMTALLDSATPVISTTSDADISYPVMTLALTLPGGAPALPDYLAQPFPMTLGLYGPGSPTVSIQYPDTVFAPAMGLSLDVGPSPSVNLTTNVLKIAPAMTMSLNMVGIFDAAHDRYLNVLPPTIQPMDIWYKLDEASGSVAADSSVDPLYVTSGGWAEWLQNGAYHGTLNPIGDGPQLRKGIHFDGATNFLTVGPYTQRDPDPDITAFAGVSVEFSIRTTQTDGVVFTGTGFQYHAQSANGPALIGNELRLESGMLVVANARGEKVKVRRFIADGHWHHIVFTIPQFKDGGGFPLDSSQVAYVMVDGDHALVRYNTFLADQGYGGDWLPYTVMARATTLTGNLSPSGFLAGDLSNFIVRINNYITTQEAQTIYYEWSDANIVHPTPATVALSAPAPVVKGSVKKMLALYGLPFSLTGANAATGAPGETIYNYLDILSGMIIDNLGGSFNLQANLGGNRYWSAPKPFMLDDFFVIPVSIFGNLYNNDQTPLSVNGTLNSDSVVTVDGLFVNDETGRPRFINLQNDLSTNVSEEYDVITFVNYPWEKQYDTGSQAIQPVEEGYVPAYVIPFHGHGNMTDTEWEQARDDMRDSIMEAVYDGCSMWIGDYYAAQHLGFIQGYDIHKFDRFDLYGNNVRGLELDQANLASGMNTGATDYFSYPQVNFYRRITALVPGLTDLPGNDWGDWVEGWNTDEWKPNGNFVAWNVLRRPNGLQLNDRVTMRNTWMNSKFWGQTSGSNNSVSFPTSRVAVTSAHPDGICGTVVSREQDSYYGPGGVVVNNPYKDNALTIAAEQGTIVNGRPIGGRVFIELMSTEIAQAGVWEDADKTLWGGNPLQPGQAQPSRWDYDSRRGKEVKITLNTSLLGIGSDGTMSLSTKTTEFFQYQNGSYLQNLYLPMTYRGLKWLSQTTTLAPGDAKGFASAMTLTLTTPNAALSHTANPSTQVIGPMRLGMELRQPANYSDGSIEANIFGGMEMFLELRGLGRTVGAPPMSLTMTTVNPNLKVEADTVIVYLDEGRNITLFLKEDN